MNARVEKSAHFGDFRGRRRFAPPIGNVQECLE
jgi:hypothetical protein